MVCSRKKKKVQGTKWRGYCLFPAPGREIAGGVTTRAVWRAYGKRACVHDQAATRVAAHATAPALVRPTTLVLSEKLD